MAPAIGPAGKVMGRPSARKMGGMTFNKGGMASKKGKC
jgi:hypothetical protein